MTIASLGSIPENLTVAQVYELQVPFAPATIFGRRNAYDELIYDADGGFTSAWAGSSSLVPNGDDTYTLVLGRRAYSMAGLAVFAGDGAGGGGSSGDATSIQTIPVVGTPTDEQIMEYDSGTNEIHWVDNAGGGGSFSVTPTPVVDGHLIELEGTDGLTGKDSGIAASDILALLTSTVTSPAYYYGESAAGAITSAQSSTTWASFIAIFTGTWQDKNSSAISRSGNTFTVTRAGVYAVHMKCAIFASASGYLGFRIRSGGATLASMTDYAATGTGEMSGMVNCIVPLTAGQSFTVEYVTQTSLSFGGVASLDSQAMPLGSISIAQLGGTQVGATQSSVDAAVAAAIVAAGPTPAVYRGGSFTANELRYVSGAWTGCISSVFTGSWTDEESTLITRSGENFTIAEAGRYRIHAYFPSFTSGTPPLRGLRCLKNGVMVASALSYGGSGVGSTSDTPLIDVITCAAGDVLKFEYINVTGTTNYGAFTSGQMGSVNIKTGQICIERTQGIIVGATQAQIAAAVAAAAGSGGWLTYADFNFTQMANQSFPTAGDVTINGITFQAGNVGTGAQTMAIVNGTGLVFTATSSTNTFWYGSGHAAAYLGLDLDRLPNYLLETSECRIFSEYYLTVGTANYATACFGFGKRVNFSGADFSPMMRHYYDSGLLKRGVFMPLAGSEEGNTGTLAHNVAAVHYRSAQEIAWYAKTWAGADIAANSVVFDDQNSMILQARRWEAVLSASSVPKIMPADKLMVMLCGQNGNTSGNTVSTFKRMRIEYKPK